jgi:tRNA/rRNA methyltransferase/putative endonuclease
MPFTYMLRCSDGSLYVGSTRNLEHRMNDHHLGLVEGFTSVRRPVQLIWFEEFERIDEAHALEQRLKGWRREKKLALAAGRFDRLPELSRSGSHLRSR